MAPVHSVQSQSKQSEAALKDPCVGETHYSSITNTHQSHFNGLSICLTFVLPFYLMSVYYSTSLSVVLSIYISIYLCVCLSVYLSSSPSVSIHHLSIVKSISRLLYLSLFSLSIIFLSTNLSVCHLYHSTSSCLSILLHVSFDLPVYLANSLSFYLLACLYYCPPVSIHLLLFLSSFIYWHGTVNNL